ncbi:MAG: GNAT family N-acetyltransferase [Actinobacteria bacterium]|nr:GNAT family N-acetyltransferase [Actinomycetota bacterium]MBU1942582.1 GNAT family N-acetyltransferase [Actinomycetota bacterium]MBU2688742.1 GNAT family N-acetyltransferase [Actinomycetota bacterium]
MDDGHDGFDVRAFDPVRDIEGAYECFVSGFYHNSWPLIDHAEKRLLTDSILMAARMSQVSLVAEVDGEARGVLFGYFPREGLTLLRSLVETARFTLRVLLRRYCMTPFGRAAFWRHHKGEISFVIRHTDTRAEVLLLSSQKEYRGGIGRALMDEWVTRVRERGYDSTTVSTDSTVSWGFYERYGFRRVREFPLKMFFYSLPGEDVRGYIYRLDL